MSRMKISTDANIRLHLYPRETKGIIREKFAL